MLLRVPRRPPKQAQEKESAVQHISSPQRSCSCLSTRCQEHSGNGKKTSLPAPSEPAGLPSLC